MYFANNKNYILVKKKIIIYMEPEVLQKYQGWQTIVSYRLHFSKMLSKIFNPFMLVTHYFSAITVIIKQPKRVISKYT